MKKMLNVLNAFAILLLLACVILTGWTNPQIKNMAAFYLISSALVIDVLWLLIKDLMR